MDRSHRTYPCRVLRARPNDSNPSRSRQRTVPPSPSRPLNPIVTCPRRSVVSTFFRVSRRIFRRTRGRSSCRDSFVSGAHIAWNRRRNGSRWSRMHLIRQYWRATRIWEASQPSSRVSNISSKRRRSRSYSCRLLVSSTPARMSARVRASWRMTSQSRVRVTCSCRRKVRRRRVIRSRTTTTVMISLRAPSHAYTRCRTPARVRWQLHPRPHRATQLYRIVHMSTNRVVTVTTCHRHHSYT